MAAEGGDAVWVEGEDEGACPLKQGDGALGGVALDPAKPGSALASLLDDALGEAKALRPFDLQGAVDAGLRVGGRAVDGVKSLEDLASGLGLDRAYVESEMKLFKALSSGEALADHLEPAYFQAFLRAREERG